jgi:hypothetical protein
MSLHEVFDFVYQFYRSRLSEKRNSPDIVTGGW